MAKILVLQGLPASGKTTYAKKLLAESPSGYAMRINNDDLADSMFGETFGGGHNSRTLLAKLRISMVRIAVASGYQLVIVDNTNLAPTEVRALERLSKTLGVEFEIDNSFLSVSLYECLERNAQRENPVPEHVIFSMAKSAVVAENRKRDNQDDQN